LAVLVLRRRALLAVAALLVPEVEAAVLRKLAPMTHPLLVEKAALVFPHP
jgi:hypothetical protein